MPYVSPRGLVKAAAPPRRKSTAAMFKDAGPDHDQALENEAGRVFLDVSDLDPEAAEMMEEMGHWTGWTSTVPHQHHLDGSRVFEDEDGDGSSVDPIDELGHAMERTEIAGPDASGKGLNISLSSQVERKIRTTSKNDSITLERTPEIEDVHQEPGLESPPKGVTPEDNTPKAQ
jgi:hypothetical protein